jgi:beta-barrel assembly-enhancing protease
MAAYCVLVDPRPDASLPLPLIPTLLNARACRASVLSLACFGLLAPAVLPVWAQQDGAVAPAPQASAMTAPPADANRWAPAALPALGDASAQALSPMAERRLGDRIMRSLLRDPDVIDDPLVLEYVSQLWARLLAGARARGEIGPELEASHAWQPFLVRDKSVNAFALPGGYIGVHLGLLAMTTSPDELASVLAHELSHVTQRHIARMIGQQSQQSWISIASLLLGVLAATRNAVAAQALIYGGQAAAIQTQLNFSRDMEREADRVGFGVLGDSGFDPAGMALMFEHLQAASRLNDDGSWPYLRTHPLTTERIGEAQARLGPAAWGTLPSPLATSTAVWAQHQLMAARARVLVDVRSEALQTLSTPQLPKDATRLQVVTAWYMAALARQRSAQPEAAQQALATAREQAAGLPSLQQDVVWRVLSLAQAEGQLRRHQGGAALETLQAALQRPGSIAKAQARPELLSQAHAALTTPDDAPRAAARDSALHEAASRLQTHVSDHPLDAPAWSVLSEVWQALHQPVRAVRAEAEATAALGDLPGAIDRVQGARRRFRQVDAPDLIELSVMDARMRVWQRQQREDLRDEGGKTEEPERGS